MSDLPVLTFDVWQRAAIALCEYACGYAVGRSKDDVIYKEVTENRDGPGPEQRKRYSSCGDLAHWFYRRLGIRETWVNRTDDNMYGPWKPGANVTQLWGSACPFDQVPPNDPNWLPGPGDVVLIWNTGNDAHVMVSLGVDETGQFRTANFGAGGMSPSASPGSKINSTTKVTWKDGKPFYGSRQIQRYLPLSEAIKHVTVKPDLSGELKLTGEDVDAIELGWNTP